ncbi:hypothetical protein [Meiothermus sp.]|uniref:TapB family protein n=1 Tax=Meiothermus sp. TaxID=1955249 RepID=UPI0021DE2AA8|nr:hypothetical protein [Meiothermus sp.]GIW25610.1 MAG: hypothetical protein KatS3mg069_1877 [Meiothermus sp.]
MRSIVGVLVLLACTAWARCDHPYYPVREGWVWTYRSSADKNTYTIQTLEVKTNGFIQRFTFPSFGFDSRWICDARGLTQPEFTQSGQSNMQMKFKTRKASGVLLPQNLRVGSSWSYSYEVSGEAQQGNLTIELEQSIHTTSKAVGQESVSVPAGRFMALKVESTQTIRGTMKMGGRSSPMNLSVKSTSWYAPNVGLVKSQSEGVLIELVSLKR